MWNGLRAVIDGTMRSPSGGATPAYSLVAANGTIDPVSGMIASFNAETFEIRFLGRRRRR
jgi:hypothetical protein